jgi:tetratricopeptide (TPR) repeat protein
MRKRIAIAVFVVALLAAGTSVATAVIRAHCGYRAAEHFVAHHLWPQARERLESYLWLHPNDGQARLLMADALVHDETLPAAESASQAIQYLAQIPDDSPWAAEARFREGGFYFLILQQPGRGERLLRRAIELGEGQRAQQLLWTLLSFSGQADQTEDLFWQVYEQSAEDERPLRLREWYLYQLSPVDAHEYLDRQMGILSPSETPNRSTESRRYLRFREREPESPIGHVAVAQWCQEEGDPEFALRVLKAAAKQLPEADSDRFFLSVSIATHLDLGQFEEARACFCKWPQSDRGHAYWKWRAAIYDDVLHRHEEALAAYDQALTLWPGPADWTLHHRRAVCLARVRRLGEAETAKERVEHLKRLMTSEASGRRRAALNSLANPDQLAEVAQFYRQLGRNREADCWERHIERLRSRVAKSQ